MKSFATALMAGALSGASALSLRDHSEVVKEWTMAEVAAEIDQSFTWSATHACTFVTDRLSD